MKWEALLNFLSQFYNVFNKCNNTGARMLDSIYYTTIKLV